MGDTNSNSRKDAGILSLLILVWINEKPSDPDSQTSTFYSENRSLDSLIALRISLVVALVWIPGTSNGDFLLFLKIIEKDSPPLLLMTTSSFLAILRTSARRCLASEYVYPFIIVYSKIEIPISRATLCIPWSSVSNGLRRFRILKNMHHMHTG